MDEIYNEWYKASVSSAISVVQLACDGSEKFLPHYFRFLHDVEENATLALGPKKNEVRYYFDQERQQIATAPSDGSVSDDECFYDFEKVAVDIINLG